MQQRALAEKDPRIAWLEPVVEELRRCGRPGPARVDQHVVAQRPLFWRRCNRPVRVAGKADQYQTDLPRVKPLTTYFEVHFGRRTVWGRHAQGFRTAKRRGHDGIALFAGLLRAPKTVVHPLLLASVN